MPNQIRLYYVALNALKALFSVYLLSLGIMILTTPPFQMGYGLYFEGTGVGILMLAFLEPMNAAIGHSGAQRHNKFLLLTNLLFDLILMVTQMGLAVTLLDAAQVSYIAPEFDPEQRELCLMKDSIERDDELCNAYLKSDRYSGMKLAWYSFYESINPNDQRDMENLALEGECCGFGQTKACVPDRSPFPDHVSHACDVDAETALCLLRKDRVMCGGRETWYAPADLHCPAASMGVSDISLGCQCEFPIGSCCDPFIFTDESKGCASFFDSWLGLKIEQHGVFLLICMVLQVINMAVACCYCMKRRSDDVMPDYLANEPWDPYGKDGIMSSTVDPYNNDEGGAGAAEGES